VIYSEQLSKIRESKMELTHFEEFLERKGQLTRIQVNILRSDLELLTKYAAYVTKTKNSRLTVADLCQLAIRDYVNKHKDELIEKIGDFEYVPRGKRQKKEPK
jgi:hypothetical protein